MNAGNVTNWWDNTTIANYREKAKCIEDQYSDYYIQRVNMSINGTLTLRENIADVGGAKAAYMAYGNYSNQYQIRIVNMYIIIDDVIPIHAN